MQIKSVIIDNIPYINFISFNISTLLHINVFLICPVVTGKLLYTSASYMTLNTVTLH